MEVMTIRPFERSDEQKWLRCRVLSFLDSAYFDNVERAKPTYQNPSIELVADNGDIVGFLDIELESTPGSVCRELPGLGGMIWHLGVHPDHRRIGIARQLLREGVVRAKAACATALQAWTRDDVQARAWYEKNGFKRVSAYWHVSMDGDLVTTEIPHLFPISVFAHYLGDDIDSLRGRFEAVHECVCYQRQV